MFYPIEKLRFATSPGSLLSATPFPPPYRRMLAINSDVEFTTWPAQLDLLKIFAGYRLETAASFWVYSDPDTTWRMLEADGTPSAQGRAAFSLARAGLLDTLHSFGGAMNGRGVEFGRDDIARAYRVLRDNGIVVRIYSNHGTTQDTQNIGGEWVNQPGNAELPEGRRAGSPTLSPRPHPGARGPFLLAGHRPSPRGELVRAARGRRSGRLFEAQVSRDGNSILRFRRTDSSEAPDAVNLGKQLNRVLTDEKTGYCVVYTHLGVLRDDAGRPVQNTAPYLNTESRNALERLGVAQERGDVLVTTTRRLLTHALLMAAQPWELSLRWDGYLVELHREFTYAGVRF